VIGGTSLALVGGGALGGGFIFEKGLFLDAQPYNTKEVQLAPAHRQMVRQVNQELTLLSIELGADWAISESLEIAGPVNPAANVAAAQRLLQKGEEGLAAYSSIQAAPSHPAEARKVLQMLVARHKKGKLPDSILQAAAGLAPYAPDEMRKLIREYDASFAQKAVLDIAIDPSGWESKLPGPISQISRKYPLTLAPDLLTVRLAAHKPDAMIDYIAQLPNKTPNDQDRREYYIQSLIPYRPQYVWRYMQELEKDNSKYSQTKYSDMAVKFAPYHPEVTKHALEHLTKVKSTNGGVYYLAMALAPHAPSITKAWAASAKRDKNPYWELAFNLVLSPNNKDLAKMKQNLRGYKGGAIDLVRFLNAFTIAHTQY